ncbi:methylthioribulose 1-phosphate dehydratase [Saxibacter everestensis]|uniref:Methylthioribulose-1-phosphate dehydratase n=1 Tax=Saxibacter everestensis TaxID=2909229 RepID=A0ABY8QS41_9MICO|nr:methylthioribulose 1-phosphate dehydratase [Brevibacteriaceae bacterium ZFBP1038]
MTAPERATLEAAGRALAAESARFAGMGWMRGTSGNLSVTLTRNPLRLAVTASGLDKNELTGADIVVIDRLGEPVDIPQAPGQPALLRAGLRPSAEAGLHARIAEVTGAGAVVHVHQLSAVLAGHYFPDGVPIRDMEMLKGIGHSAHDQTVTVPVVPNDQDMTVLGDAFEQAYVPATDDVAEVPVLIVANHGIYAWGADLLQARQHAEIIEWLLRFKVETREPAR